VPYNKGVASFDNEYLQSNIIPIIKNKGIVMSPKVRDKNVEQNLQQIEQVLLEFRIGGIEKSSANYRISYSR
jgi:hypothetical protein